MQNSAEHSSQSGKGGKGVQGPVMNVDLDGVQVEDINAPNDENQKPHVSAVDMQGTKLQKIQQAMNARPGQGAKELAKKFIQQEEDSFNLFKAVGQLKNQVENTEMQLFELQAQIDKMNLEEEDMRRARANQSAMGIASKPKVSFSQIFICTVAIGIRIERTKIAS